MARRLVRPVDKSVVISRLSLLVNNKTKVVMFNNHDVYLVKAIIAKAKTQFTITYGRSGIQVRLED